MIHDIGPDKLKNEYIPLTPGEGDSLFCFDSEGRVLLEEGEETIVFPTPALAVDHSHRPIYLFSLEEVHFFLALEPVEPLKGYAYFNIREVRERYAGSRLFAVFTAYHLWKWYSDNRFCGKCAGLLEPDAKERALRCPKCGRVIYPRINPAVIVGVIKGDSLLLTKYRTGYGHNALVAGFTEIGETLEGTVAREVMEETGIKVKNIRYYKSQPWGIAQDILAGFYCEVDGDDPIRMDEKELRYAQWVKREEIELQPDDLSLTNEMMRQFKEGRIG